MKLKKLLAKPKSLTNGFVIPTQLGGKMAEEKLSTTKDINDALKDYLKKHRAVTIGGHDSPLAGQDSIAIGIAHGKVTVEGEAGDFFGALNNGATLILKGSAKRFLGDTMIDGEILVDGNIGVGAGTAMVSGTIVIKGNADGKVGQLNKGGTIIIKGNPGDDVGSYMLGGEIIVTDDAGKNTANWIQGGSVFVAGEIEKLGNNAKIIEISSEEENTLKRLLKRYDIKEKFDFIKIVADKRNLFSMEVF